LALEAVIPPIALDFQGAEQSTARLQSVCSRVIARAVARKGKEDLLQGMLASTRAEPGCRLYELYESGERGRFYFYELWENQAALEQHAASPHYKHLELNLRELLEEDFEVNILQEVLSLGG
jgi:quinol monooxygenase YgiN